MGAGASSGPRTQWSRRSNAELDKLLADYGDASLVELSSKEEFLAGFRSINTVLDQALTDDQIISIMQSKETTCECCKSQKNQPSTLNNKS